MRRFLLSITAIVAITYASSANAGVLLEPYLNYNTGIAKPTVTMSGVDVDFPRTSATTGFGARIGYSFTSFFLAADYAMYSGKLTSQDVTIGGVAYSVDPKEYTVADTMLGVTAGIGIPMFRFYLGYDFDVKSKQTSTSAAGTKGDITWSGTSIKVGAGYTGLPVVAINLEYYLTTYTKGKDNLSGVEASLPMTGSYKTFVDGGFRIGLSAPFNL